MDHGAAADAFWLLRLVETSALGDVARRSSWLYPLANIAHVLGAALLVGAIAVFDILVLRRAEGAGLFAAGRIAVAVSATGLALQVASGIVLFAAEATALGRNPVFLAKLVFILLGLVNVAWMHARYAGSDAAGAVIHGARAHAAASLGLWVLVLILGRAIAYV